MYRSVLGGGVEKGLTEALPILVVGGGLNNNLLVVIRELVDDVLVLLAELQVIVGSYALLRNGGSEKVRRVSCVVRRRSRLPPVQHHLGVPRAAAPIVVVGTERAGSIAGISWAEGKRLG